MGDEITFYSLYRKYKGNIKRASIEEIYEAKRNRREGQSVMESVLEAKQRWMIEHDLAETLID